MKRSSINYYLSEGKAFFERFSFKLPPWAFWAPEDWKSAGVECDEIRNCHLGWDITDFGGGRFEQLGLLLFTIRNGVNTTNPPAKTYAEKIMIVRPQQVTPLHFHWLKMEDIINRGGGTLVLKLWRADKNEGLSNENFSVQVDGVTKQMSPGGILKLQPGESITLEPYVYHTFWAEHAMTLVGEVSQVNHDSTDNRFYEPLGRFPSIEEDESPLHLLCTEYPEAKS